MKLAKCRLMIAVVVLAVSGVNGVTTDVGKPVDKLLLAPDLWTLSSDSFAAKAGPGYGFQWVSTAKDSARSADRTVTFMGEPVVEVLVRFSSNVVSSVLVSFYNRGDAGNLDEQVFQRQADRVSAALDSLAGVKARHITPSGPTRANRKAISRLWDKAPNSFVLESAVSRDAVTSANRPDFLNLSITRSGSQSVKQMAGEQKVALGISELKKRIKRTPEGDVYLENVPMVDQGLKGYCAVATTERVMRYYGVEVNQHELAQKAMTGGGGGGTDPESLVKALKAMAGYLGVQVKTLEDFSVKDFCFTIRDYNKVAKRRKVPGIDLPMSGCINVAEVYAAMDRETFRDTRLANASRVQHFSKLVKDKLESGYPVLWGVMLGMVDEKPELPQSGGGHLRVIIGYNAKTSEILYSDSWGAGHELKRMSLKDAFVMTMTLITIEPR